MLIRLLVVSVGLAAQSDPARLVREAREESSRNRPDEAKQLLGAAIELFASSAAPHADEYAQALFELSELTPASAALLDKALTLPTSPRVAAEGAMRRGIRHVGDKEFDKAERSFADAAKRDSSQASRASLWLAITYSRNGRQDEARRAIQDAIDKATSPRPTAQVAASIYDSMGLGEDAAAMRKRATEMPRAPVHSTLVGVHRVGGGVSAPSILLRFEPHYSEEARVAKHMGTVQLYVVIGASGIPEQVEVLRELGMGLDERAIDAVKTWRFRPGMKDGMPVRVAASVDVNFKLL